MLIRSRRNFIKSTFNVGLVASTSALLPRLATAEAMGVPPGIQLYSVRDDLVKDTPGTLRQLREIGFLEIETAGTGKYTPSEFRQLLDDAGLRHPSAHIKFVGSELGPLFEQANTLGVHYAVSSSLATANAPAPPTNVPVRQRPAMAPLGLEGFTRLAAQMNDIGSQARKAGLQYAYHNHNYEFEKMPDGSFGYDILVRDTDRDLVKFEIDCGWMCAGGANPVHYMEKYPGRFKMIHVKEFQPFHGVSTSLTGPTRPLGADLGQGFINYKGIFAAGRRAGIQHAFSEQEDPFPVSQMASAKAAYKFLRDAS